MKQNVAANLMLGDYTNAFDFFGMAKITMVDSLDEAHPIAPAKSATPAPAAAAPRNDTPFHETQIVFANSAKTPIIDTDSDARSGYQVTLSAMPGKPDDFVAIVAGPSGASQALPVKNAGKGWSNLFGGGDPNHFRVAQVCPDFVLKAGVPATLSDQPRIPVALVPITGPTKLLPPAAPSPVATAPPMPKGLAMRIALAKEPGRIVYEM